MSFDVARVRGLYPTLGSSMAQLEGPLGALQPETVIRAIITTLRSAPAQPGSRSTRSRRSASAVNAARAAVADLVGASGSDCVVFGSNQATLMMQFVELLSADWQLGDDIVVSRLDADSDLRHLLLAAHAIGVGVKWAEVDLETGDLPAWQYEHLVNAHTRIVTLPLANPVTGSIPDVRAIADRAHEVGALVIVNAGAALSSLPIDLEALGADLLSISIRTFGGPTLAAMIARPGLLTELAGDNSPVGPASQVGPESLELGPLPVELMDGVTAAVDHLASLDDTAHGGRRVRLLRSLTEVRSHEQRVFNGLLAQLSSISGITVLGRPANRVPVVAFTVARYRPDEVGDFLARHGVAVWTGGHGQHELISAFGADELGGPVLVGIMPHTTAAEVDVLIGALQKLVLGGLSAGPSSGSSGSGGEPHRTSWSTSLSGVG
jgi:cysteine desulfurase family protein (TIGR01976 family)